MNVYTIYADQMKLTKYNIWNKWDPQDYFK